ncbi:MAG: DUF5320 domain-containing protein [Nitrospirae bacterium]|jgi:hypothetical protein|nr:DUF5320 domain-containing protein [Nitrospirota bacterium]
MPFGDRTGPVGLGSRTGRAAGYCSGFGMPGYANPVSGGGRFGFGRGWGRGYGSFGRGRGWRHWYRATGLPGWARTGYGYPPGGWMSPYTTGITAQEEMDLLRDQADFLRKQLEDIEKRIITMGKTRPQENE